ncbi:MAG: acyltransferase family protein [Saprospirales bacterium]|nr:acyltransferase family protein [Saprospirales bacterium]MBK8922835.1 acyltransferase family protein [Saprospirales bacterium]
MQNEKTAPAAANILPWADRLRNLATLLVLAIHVAAPLSHEDPNLDTWNWWAANWWDALGRPSVNLFVMLSGFLLFGKHDTTETFLRKRFARVLIPSLVWMAPYLLYNHFAHNNPATLQEALVKLVQGPVHYHLWFIYLILGLYLVYPVLRPWVQQARERDFWYFFAACALGTWLYKVLVVFYHLKIGLHMELFTNQIGHFVLGYYLANKVLAGESAAVPGIAPWPFSRRQITLLALALIGASTVFTAVAGYWHSSLKGSFQPYFYDYLAPNVTLGAIGWLLLARHNWNRRPLLEVESLLAVCSFGIYLVHVFVMDWLAQCGYWHSKGHPAKAIPLVLAMTALFSFLAILLIRSLPFGKKIV